MGIAALAESLTKTSPAGVKRRLGELERARLILVDANQRLIYVRGSIEADPPTTENAVRGMALQVRELPDSPVTVEIRRAVAGALAGFPSWLTKWNDESAPEASPATGPGPGLSSGPGSGPLRIPYSDSGSEDRDPTTAAATAARFLRAFDRLPAPPFAAAAAEDVRNAVKNWPEGLFNALVRQLACSKWVTGKMNIPPTLSKLIANPDYAERVIAGEFRSLEGRWKCPDCQLGHEPTDECPELCRACHIAHNVGYLCTRLENLKADEAEQAELNAWSTPSGETWPALVARVGIRQAFQIKRDCEPARAMA
jgi:hypothetical protein